MVYRILWAVGALAAVTMVAAQGVRAAGGQDGALADETWTAPRTPWGAPDLAGIWNGKSMTPVERPDRFAGREFLTDEEVAELEAAAIEEPGRNARATKGTHDDVEGAYNDVFTSRSTNYGRTKRTSLIVNPPDGTIPERLNSAEPLPARPGGDAESRRTFEGHYFVDTEDPRAENPEDRPSDRCLGVRLPPARIFIRLVQGPEQVSIYYERGHQGGAFRTIHLNGEPHLAPHIRQWLGDARGHWEGDTLVVDTANFTSRTNYRGSRENLHLTERFTRAGPDLLMYNITVEDPTVWTKPWTMEVPLTKADNKENLIFEAACHEGNYALTSILAGARLQEQKAAAAGTGSK